MRSRIRKGKKERVLGEDREKKLIKSHSLTERERNKQIQRKRER